MVHLRAKRRESDAVRTHHPRAVAPAFPSRPRHRCARYGATKPVFSVPKELLPLT